MDSGAKAAISGFRRQALYTLALILDEAESGRVFQPEGKEDLAVYENGQLVRSIQVKAYTSPLRLSDLDPRKKGSFLHRLVDSGDESSVPQLVSFGPLGAELEGVQAREKEALERLSEKLEEYDYSAAEIHAITERLEIIQVDEAALQERVYRFFTKTMTAGEPERAFDLLVWWILQAAEGRRSITFESLRDRLLAVGRYFAERSAHHDEWFTTIKPLGEQVATAPPNATLAEEYYRGAGARYTHISAGLDVRRKEQLENINGYFEENRKVVIIHGASGQGKTSLALRFLHDYVPSDWRFMVTSIDDRRHAAKIANALADHLRVVSAPVWLFIDVAPRDLQWVALIRELLDIENIRILVAIREEDLARRAASESEIGFPADIRLDLTEQEAAEIYALLMQQASPVNAFPTFHEAWARFGGEGPLLEFVYLVTQTMSLRSVLASQVRRLREEVRSGSLEPAALRLLHICAIATSFEARIKLVPMITLLDLKDPTGTIALFENEFLLRVSTDRRQVEALHPVRSSLLAKELEDAAFAQAEEVALQGLPHIPEIDLEIFLLYFLSRMPGSWLQLREALASLKIETWTGAAGIGRALLWWGIRSYLEANRSTIDEAIKIGGDAWVVTVLPDVAGALEEDIAESILQLIEGPNPAGAEQMRRLRRQLTPQAELFGPFAEWLSKLSTLKEPLNLNDWEGVAELTFWSSRLGVPSPATWKQEDLPASGLSIEALSQLCLALAEAEPEKRLELMRLHGEPIVVRFREDTDTLILREDDESVTSEFIVPLDALSSAPKRLSDDEVKEGKESSPESLERAAEQGLDSRLNDEAVRRAELLRGLFPGKQRYCTQGIGHSLSFGGIRLPHDSTVKKMPPSVLPAPWLVRVNSTLHSLGIYERRPATWRLFAARLVDIRGTVASVLLQLQRALIAYFEGSKSKSLLDGKLSHEVWGQAKIASGAKLYLPKVTVDEWGLSSETQRSGSGKKEGFSVNIASGFSLRRHQTFLKALRDYFLAVSNFFNQAEVVCVAHGLAGRDPVKRDMILGAAKNAGYNENNTRLSIHNLFQAMVSLEAMQAECDKRIGSLVEPRGLAQVRSRERNLFPELWALWYQFCHHPESRMRAAGAQSLSAMEGSLSSIRHAFRSVVSDAWNMTVLSEKLEWSGRAALVFSLNLRPSSNLDEARSEAVGHLVEILAPAANGSLESHAIDYFWHHVILIPVIDGVAPEPIAWILPASMISGRIAQQFSDSPSLRIPQYFPAERMKELGLEVRSASRKSFRELLEKLAGIQFHFSHLASFAEHVPQLDNVGVRILEQYLEKAEQQLKGRFDGLLEMMIEVKQEAARIDGLDQDELDTLLAPITELIGESESSGEEVTVGLRDCEAKAEQFQQIFQAVSIVQALYS